MDYDIEIFMQERLVVGPFVLIHPNETENFNNGNLDCSDHDDWATPGGGRMTTEEAVRLAAYRGWDDPKRIRSPVKRLIHKLETKKGAAKIAPK